MTTYAQLNRTHADYDAKRMERYADLFAGGAAVASRMDRYLPRHAPMEPVEVWRARLEAAHYLNYCGPIGGQLAAWLFTAPFDTAPASGSPSQGDAKWWPAWRADCDGQGTDLEAFLRARFLDSLVHQRGWLAVEWPEGSATDAATWRDAGLGDATLRAVSPLDVTAWRRGPDGSLLWVLEHSVQTGLEEITDEAELTTETWTLYRADDTPGSRTGRRWRVTYPKGKKPVAGTTAPEVEPPVIRGEGIPLVELSLPPHLWLMDHMSSAALESLRKRNALSWALDRAAFAQLVLKRKDRKRPPPVGTGYFVELGIEESMEWSSPPSTAFDILSSYCATLKDELYRVVTLMASGVDNNAAAIGRSGESKSADLRSTEIVLSAYGERVRECAARVLDVVARGRGEPITWDVSGLDHYQVTDTASLLDDAVKAIALEIPSPTARKALLTRAALALVPDADEQTRQTIRDEIAASQTGGFDEVSDEGTEEPAEETSTPATPAGARPAPGTVAGPGL